MSYGPYTFDSENDSDCQAFTFTSTNGGSGQSSAGVISAAGTAAEFCHDTDGGNTTNTGPNQGQGGVDDGYLYTECSSPGANGDEYTMTFNTTLDASVNQWQFNFYTLQRGNATIGENQSTCEVQINESGGGWTTITDVGGSGEDTTDGTDWTYRSVDLSAGGTYTDSSTQVRLLITTATNTQAYYGDYGVDTVEFVDTPLTNYQIEGTTYNVTGSVLGSCKLFLFKDNQDNTITFVDYTTSNASTGAYLFENISDNNAQYFVRAWKDDSPHIFDVTDHDCQPAETPSVSYDLYLRSDSDKGESSPDNDLRLRSDVEKLTTDPLITNAGDEDFLDDETDIDVVGINFGDSQTGSADIEIGDNATYGSCVDIESQTVNSWSDTQINIDINFGSSTLEYGSNWLYVTESGGTTSASYAINLYKANTITGVSPAAFVNGTTGITISGSDFGGTKGSSVVYLADQADGGGTNVEQTTTDWSSNSITFTCVQGGLSKGPVYVIVARNNSGLGDSGARFSNGYTATLYETPTVTNIDDEDLIGNETNILIDGTNFGTSQGSGYVEIGNNSSYASCTVKSTQSIDTWNDTQIQVDIVLGSLNYGSNWCFVTNGGASRNDPGYAVNLYKANTISSISPGSFRNGDTSITVSGSDFGDTKGSSVLYLADQADGGGTNVAQTTTDWSSNSITFTCVQGGLSVGSVYVIVSRNNSGLGDTGARFSNGYPATLLAPPAFSVSSSGYVSNDTDTTRQLSVAPSGDFSAGKVYTTQNPGGEKSLPADGFTEYEWCLQATTSSEAGAQYEFRLSAPGKVILLNKIPKVTISS